MQNLFPWLSKTFPDKAIDLLLLVVFVYTIGYAVVIFIRTLRKYKTNVSVSKEGISIEKEEKPQLEEDCDKYDELQEKVKCLERELERHTVQKKLIPLNQHSVFITLQSLMERGVLISNSENVSREKLRLNNEFLNIKFTTIYESTKEWIDNILRYRKEGLEDELQKELYGIIERIYQNITTYNSKALTKKIYFDDGRYLLGVPELYIKKFDEWHNSHVGMIIEKYRQVLYSDFYPTWEFKTIVILDHLETSINLIKIDAERTLNSMNGELDEEIQKSLR